MQRCTTGAKEAVPFRAGPFAPSSNADPLFEQYISLAWGTNAQGVTQYVVENGWVFTEAFFLNPNHDWSRSEPEGLLVIRALVGNNPFTSAVRDRLKRVWPDASPIIDWLALNDDEFVAAIKKESGADTSLIDALDALVGMAKMLRLQWQLK